MRIFHLSSSIETPEEMQSIMCLKHTPIDIRILFFHLYFIIASNPNGCVLNIVLLGQPHIINVYYIYCDIFVA